MKKYLAYVAPTVITSFLFALLLFLIIWLAGFDDWQIFAYGVLIFFVLNLGYLAFSYFLHYNMWRYLAGRGSFSAVKKDSGALSQALYRATRAEIAKKDLEIQALRDQQLQYQEFMNLWVHQMKTPVTVIDLLSQEPVIAPLALKAENERLKSGLNLALNLVRTNAFEKDFTLQEFRLKTIVTKAVQQQKITFIQRNIFPKVFLAAETILTDEKWLLFILEQIITNALKYSPAESTLNFTSTVTKDTVALHITDHGIGIPEKDLKRVTAAFFTGDNGRKYPEATGMGLYLANKVASELNIELTVSSQLDVGTTVTLIFQQPKTTTD